MPRLLDQQVIKLLLCLIMAASAFGQAPAQPCILDLPVFDATGNRIPFAIKSVRLRDSSTDLLTSRDNAVRATLNADRTRLHFPRVWIDRAVVEVTLESPAGRIIKESIEVSGCEQRTSLDYDQRDTGFDVRVSTVEGQIVGCELNGDWWIRAMQMFGGHQGFTYEGFIRPDGSFVLAGNMRGVRHILVVGHDKQPLTTLGVDVTSGGGKANVGKIDVSKTCPK